MRTISSVVKEIIEKSPFLEEILVSEVCNLSALAKKIKKKVEKKLLKEVKEGSVIVALKRLAKEKKEIKKELEEKIKKVFGEKLDLIVKSNLVEYSFLNSDSLIEKQKHLLKQLESQRDYFFAMARGTNETTFVVNQNLEKKIEEIFKNEKMIKKLKDLSSLTIKLPEKVLFLPGVYFFFLRALALEKINVIEVISTFRELNIILEDKDIERAFSVLRNIF